MKLQDDFDLLNKLIEAGLMIHKPNILRVPIIAVGFRSDINPKSSCQGCGKEILLYIKDKNYYRIRKACNSLLCRAHDKVTPVVEALIKINLYNTKLTEVYEEFPQLAERHNEHRVLLKNKVRQLEKDLNQCKRIENELRVELNKPKEQSKWGIWELFK